MSTWWIQCVNTWLWATELLWQQEIVWREHKICGPAIATFAKLLTKLLGDNTQWISIVRNFIFQSFFKVVKFYQIWLYFHGNCIFLTKVLTWRAKFLHSKIQWQKTSFKKLLPKIFLRHCIFPLLTHFSAILIKTEGICFSLMQEKSESKQSRFNRVTSSRKLIILGNFNHRQFYGPHL